jgi:hypothetical protein
MASLCEPVVLFQSSNYAAVAEIAVDANNVYWTGNGVMQLSLGGGTPLTLAGGATQGIAVDATSVYWTDYSINTRIAKVTIGGGTVTALASVAGSKPSELAIDGTSVYWTDVAAHTVSKVSKSGGMVTMLASTGAQPSGIVVNVNGVYVSTFGGSISVPISGGTSTQLSTDAGFGNQNVAIDATSMYWLDDQNGPTTLYKVPLAGGTTITLATGLYDAVSIALDGTDLYIGGVGIWRIPTAGGTPVQVTKLNAQATSIQTDATYVYVAAVNGSVSSYVMRVAK